SGYTRPSTSSYRCRGEFACRSARRTNRSARQSPASTAWVVSSGNPFTKIQKPPIAVCLPDNQCLCTSLHFPERLGNDPTECESNQEDSVCPERSALAKLSYSPNGGNIEIPDVFGSA